MKYAIIVFGTANEVVTGNGTVYGWYESLATAMNTATNLTGICGTYYHATVVKMV